MRLISRSLEKKPAPTEVLVNVVTRIHIPALISAIREIVL
jgi:hypothetical protein